jgi:hypothetical protein
MMDKIANINTIILVSIALIFHVLKIVFLYWQPSFIKKYKFLIQTDISKFHLLLYYLLVIIVTAQILHDKL